MRQIREGVVSTLCQCEGRVRGMLVDELSGHLYVAAGDRILTVVVPSRAQILQEKYAPILRVWSLMQRRQGRALLVPAEERESAQEARAREALRRLMDCPIVDILQRMLVFAYT